MNKYDYIMKRIENGRGIKVDRQTVYGRGSWMNGESAKRYRGGEWMVDNEGNRVKGGKLENNTYAYVESFNEEGHRLDTIVIRFHTTDILRLYPDGIVVALSSHDSFTTRKRHKEYMASGWSTWSHRDQVFVGSGSCWIPGKGIVLPFEEGIVTGWTPTATETLLALGCRVGDAEAAAALATLFEERAKNDIRNHAWNRMSEIVFDRKGERYKLPNYRLMRKAWVDEPATGGLWLADKSSGVLVRALTKRDELMGFSEDATSIQIGDKVFDLVDGFEYSAKGLK